MARSRGGILPMALRGRCFGAARHAIAYGMAPPAATAGRAILHCWGGRDGLRLGLFCHFGSRWLCSVTSCRVWLCSVTSVRGGFVPSLAVSYGLFRDFGPWWLCSVTCREVWLCLAALVRGGFVPSLPVTFGFGPPFRPWWGHMPPEAALIRPSRFGMKANTVRQSCSCRTECASPESGTITGREQGAPLKLVQ